MCWWRIGTGNAAHIQYRHRRRRHFGVAGGIHAVPSFQTRAVPYPADRIRRHWDDRCRRIHGTAFVSLIQRLGIDEREFIRATEATYKLGIQFVGWHQRNKKYFHPFGVIGRAIGNHDFYQCWLKARAHGDTSSLMDFSPCNVMAENGRFFPPAEARNTPIGGANYALHVDALLVPAICAVSPKRADWSAWRVK